MINGNYKYSEISDLIIKCYFNVYNKLGYGFLEKVYENALFFEIRKLGLSCFSQYPIAVYYEENKIGQYYADLIVDDTVIIEVKAAEGLSQEHENQLVNYLKATEIEVGMLLNFGKKPEFRRKVFSSEYKALKNHKRS
ncbi:MAG: GxxExxY protein [Bacteroidetes bacterium]|nr:GxxExxY protein [Bacteroidota bacterium]